jgi:hypothetical protein
MVPCLVAKLNRRLLFLAVYAVGYLLSYIMLTSLLEIEPSLHDRARKFGLRRWGKSKYRSGMPLVRHDPLLR